MRDDQNLDTAVAIATELHGRTLDNAGRPYTGHLQRVADLVGRCGGTAVQEQAAWLHDSIEDTEATDDWLLFHEVLSEVVDLVVTLTHLPNEPNTAYLERVHEKPDAVLIKLCDISDNLDPVRMSYLDEATRSWSTSPLAVPPERATIVHLLWNVRRFLEQVS